jgi:spore coat polysaccharide biosynthesis protein SpsF
VSRNNYGIIIQARMGSTRLPGKVLRNFSSKGCILDFLVKRLKLCKTVDEIVVATTMNGRDDRIVEVAHKLGVKSFRGSESDVLNRYLECSKQFGFDNFVRVTADNPFTDHQALDLSLELHRREGVDYVTQEGIILGMASEIVRMKALEISSKDRRLTPANREHVTTFIIEHPDEFKIAYLRMDTASQMGNDDRLTVDTLEDFQNVDRIISRINYDFTVSSDALLQYLPD